MKNQPNLTPDDIAKLRSLSSLDPESFSKLIASVASSLGMSQSQTASLSKNSEGLRNMLGGASDAELSRLARSLGKEKTNTILNASQNTAPSDENG